MVIWRDVAVKIRTKQIHVKMKGQSVGRKVYHAFMNDFGDVPVVVFNEVTKKMEAVVNNRGRSYAARTRTMYRRRKQESVEL